MMDYDIEDKKEEKYIDRTWPELGVEYHWKNATISKTLLTERGTVVEMVERPQWGMACYMNGEIQSCLFDEKIYHESLVHPAMISVINPRRVLIVGGGEGSTAREVLKWQSVERVDMYEWDQEVVELFRTSYPEWGNGVWNDPRLVIHYENIFEAIHQVPLNKYDVIIIDLFEPSYNMEEILENDMWVLFHKLAFEWLSLHGSMSMYSGIRNHFRDISPSRVLRHSSILNYLTENEYRVNDMMTELDRKEIQSYKVFIPSYSGEAMFLLLKHNNVISQWNQLYHTENNTIYSHLTEEIWHSYSVWNNYH